MNTEIILLVTASSLALMTYIHISMKKIYNQLIEMNEVICDIGDTVQDIGPKIVNNAKNINRMLQS